MSDAEPPLPGPRSPDGSGVAADTDEDVAALRARIAELTDQRLRAVADLQNARKRYERELSQARSQERVRVTRQWLPVLDNLERALAHADADPKSIIDGVRAVTDQALELVSQLGFPRQDDLGAAFNAYPGSYEAELLR